MWQDGGKKERKSKFFCRILPAKRRSKLVLLSWRRISTIRFRVKSGHLSFSASGSIRNVSQSHIDFFWIASIQETEYTKETVKAGADYVKEFVIEQEGNQQQVNLDQTCFIQKGCKMCLQVNLEQEQVQEVQEEEEEEVEQKEAPEYTTIVYQDKVGVGQFFIISLEL